MEMKSSIWITGAPWRPCANRPVKVVFPAAAPPSTATIRTLWAQGRAFCWLCPPDRYQARIVVAELTDPRLFTDAVERGIEMQAPFALPEGEWEVSLDAVSRRTARVRVTSGAAVRVELK